MTEQYVKLKNNIAIHATISVYQHFMKSNCFLSYQIGQTVEIFHQWNCKGCGLIYLPQCQIFHFQYIGKSKTVFDLRFNNHKRKNIAKNAILVCKQLQTIISKEMQNLRFYKK